MWSSDFSRSPRLPYPSLPSRVYVETRLRRWRRFMAVCIYRKDMKISFFFFFFFFLEWCNLKKFRKFFVTIFVWKLFDNFYLWIFNYSNLFKDILLFDSWNIYFWENGVHAILYYISLVERGWRICTEEGSRHCNPPIFPLILNIVGVSLSTWFLSVRWKIFA